MPNIALLPDTCVLLIVVTSLALYALVHRPGRQMGRYRMRPLLTENELEFFYRLKRALPQHLIFPQVSLQALVEASSTDRRKAEADRLRIAQQRVDYVIYSPAGIVVAVVELDDRTHDRRRDAMRDARLIQAGIRTVRYESKSRPSMGAIRRDILADTGLKKTT